MATSRIRKKLGSSEDIVIHRFTVDHRSHPLLHAALNDIGIGKPRCDFIRDSLEALLSGKASQALQPEADSHEQQKGDAVSPDHDNTNHNEDESRHEKTRALLSRSTF